MKIIMWKYHQQVVLTIWVSLAFPIAKPVGGDFLVSYAVNTTKRVMMGSFTDQQNQQST